MCDHRPHCARRGAAYAGPSRHDGACIQRRSEIYVREIPGTPGLGAQQFYEWVEYVNSPAGTTTGAERRASAELPSRDPYRVRYWGIGNEVWAAGGPITAKEYAPLYKRFTAYVPTYGVDLAFIACGGPPPATDHTVVANRVPVLTCNSRGMKTGPVPRLTEEKWLLLVVMLALA